MAHWWTLIGAWSWNIHAAVQVFVNHRKCHRNLEILSKASGSLCGDQWTRPPLNEIEVVGLLEVFFFLIAP